MTTCTNCIKVSFASDHVHAFLSPCVSAASGTWSVASQSGVPVQGAFAHTSVCSEENGLVYVFGGRRSGNGDTALHYLYNTASGEWCVCAHTDTHTSTRRCTQTCIRMYIRTYKRTQTHMYVQILIHTHTHAHTHTHTHTHTHRGREEREATHMLKYSTTLNLFQVQTAPCSSDGILPPLSCAGGVQCGRVWRQGERQRMLH